MSKKVGIITLNGYKNYGNRLQNYALQESIKSLGFSVDTILTDVAKNKDEEAISIDGNKLKRLLTIEGIKKIIPKSQEILLKKKNKKYIMERTRKFKAFSKDHLSEKLYSADEKNMPRNIDDKYDFFVVGSDQVWNPSYIHGSELYFLKFASKEKRIAYAPSFGASFIPDEYTEKYKRGLSGLNCLSVREEAGAKLIKDLTGKEAQVVLDPTMLLSKENWQSMMKPAKNKPKQSYLLTYFLGEVNKETKKTINEIAAKNNFKIVNLADIKSKDYYSSDPSEFIDFINSASIFFTDSFHGAVFSVILQKSFVVFDRVGKLPSMNSRIETLLSLLDLESRHYRNIQKNDDILTIDYSHVAPVLETNRKKSLDYLSVSLGAKQGLTL